MRTGNRKLSRVRRWLVAWLRLPAFLWMTSALGLFAGLLSAGLPVGLVITGLIGLFVGWHLATRLACPLQERRFIDTDDYRRHRWLSFLSAISLSMGYAILALQGLAWSTSRESMIPMLTLAGVALIAVLVYWVITQWRLDIGLPTLVFAILLGVVAESRIVEQAKIDPPSPMEIWARFMGVLVAVSAAHVHGMSKRSHAVWRRMTPLLLLVPGMGGLLTILVGSMTPPDASTYGAIIAASVLLGLVFLATIPMSRWYRQFRADGAKPWPFRLGLVSAGWSSAVAALPVLALAPYWSWPSWIGLFLLYLVGIAARSITCNRRRPISPPIDQKSPLRAPKTAKPEVFTLM